MKSPPRNPNQQRLFIYIKRLPQLKKLFNVDFVELFFYKIVQYSIILAP